MKRFICLYYIIFAVVAHNSLLAQESLPSYPANLGEKTYIIRNVLIQHDALKLDIKYALAKLIETEVGITGIVGIGNGKIQAIDKDKQPFSDSISSFSIRFNPADINRFLDIEKFETSNQTDLTDLYDFYIEAFSKLYYKGKEVFIPPVGVLATFSKTYSGKMAWAVVDNGKNDVTVRINTDKPFKLLQEGKKEEALRESEALYIQNPENAEVLSLYGRIIVDAAKDYKKAVPILLKAIELDPNKNWISAWAYAYLGKSYFLLGDKDKASEALNKCIELNATKNVNNFAKQLMDSYGL